MLFFNRKRNKQNFGGNTCCFRSPLFCSFKNVQTANKLNWLVAFQTPMEKCCSFNLIIAISFVSQQFICFSNLLCHILFELHQILWPKKEIIICLSFYCNVSANVLSILATIFFPILFLRFFLHVCWIIFYFLRCDIRFWFLALNMKI